MMNNMITIRELNDEFRINLFAGKVILTPGIQALPNNICMDLLDAVRNFDDFDDDNDPYREHNFGSLRIYGYHVYWKVDYYDRNLEYGSEDPSNPEITSRVMTVMLSDEY